jgi:hypothetical protein
MGQMKNYLSFLVAGLLGAMLLAASSASATTLFAGGEDSDFTLAGTAGISTTNTFFVSGYAREALGISQNGCTGATPATNYALSPTFAANSLIWIHAKLYDQGAGQNNNSLLQVLSPDGVSRIIVRGNGTGGEYKISTNTASGTVTDLVNMSSACFGSAMHSFDLYINYGTSGEVTLYCDGKSYADYSGNVTTNSATQLNQVEFAGDGCAGYNGTYWSEMIVATSDTRNLRLATLAPSANGNSDNWDTGGVANVNETTDNTATVNASGTAGQIQEYTVTSMPSGSFQVLDLWENMKTQVDTTGPQHIQGMVRAGSTDYTSGNLSPQQGSWGWISTDWTTNPNTGVAWTTSDLSAVGFNMGFKSAN